MVEPLTAYLCPKEIRPVTISPMADIQQPEERDNKMNCLGWLLYVTSFALQAPS